jgi:hypothetical protein
MKLNNILKSKGILPALLVLLSVGATSRAAVINARSGSFADVSAAVASASPGDTVLMPPGTNSWSSMLTISGITLQGSGVGSTVIVDETPPVGNGTAFLQMSVVTNTITRLTQVEFVPGVTNNYSFNNYNGAIQIYGQSPFWRIDHCLFNFLTAKDIKVGDGSYGLIDHDSFFTTNRLSIEIFNTGYGDAAWAAPSAFGSSNSVYIEDNNFFDGQNFSAVDVSNGGRAVFRHNTMVGAYFNTHGSETSQRFRSARCVEVYGNTFSYCVGQPYQNFYAMCDIRGGSAVIFSNTANGYYSVASLNCYRATDNDPGFLPWFGATGLRGWDSNSAALLTGTASASAHSNVLVVAGANWTPNQWVGCTVYNSNPNSQLCGMVISNDNSSMQFMASRRAWLQIGFSPGDPFTVHKVYPMIDQPGRGQGALLTGDSPTPVWLNEASEPVYAWGNQRFLNYNVLTAASPSIGSQYPNIVANVDFFNSPRPGYVPFTYPHPLTLITNAVVDTNTVPVAPTNSAPPVNTLAPPTGLNVTPL